MGNSNSKPKAKAKSSADPPTKGLVIRCRGDQKGLNVQMYHKVAKSPRNPIFSGTPTSFSVMIGMPLLLRATEPRSEFEHKDPADFNRLAKHGDPLLNEAARSLALDVNPLSTGWGSGDLGILTAAPGNVMVMRQDKQTLTKELLNVVVIFVESFQEKMTGIKELKAREDFLKETINKESFTSFAKKYEGTTLVSGH